MMRLMLMPLRSASKADGASHAGFQHGLATLRGSDSGSAAGNSEMPTCWIGARRHAHDQAGRAVLKIQQAGLIDVIDTEIGPDIRATAHRINALGGDGTGLVMGVLLGRSNPRLGRGPYLGTGAPNAKGRPAGLQAAPDQAPIRAMARKSAIQIARMLQSRRAGPGVPGPADLVDRR